MSLTTDQLVTELKGLRRGRGLYSDNVAARVGDQLRQLCGIEHGDPPAVVRDKLSGRLGELASTLPSELETSFTVALAIHPEARQLLLQARLDWLAAHLKRDGRTARRRVDESIRRLAEAAARPVATVEVLPDGSVAGWYIERFGALLRLDLPTPEARERRIVVAERNGIERIGLAVSLPREHGDLGAHELLADVEFGGRLVHTERASDSRFQWSLALPRALLAGERHEYGITFRLPPDQPMRQHYVFTPARRCDFFDLRVRFDPGDPPKEIRRVDAAFHRDVDEGIAMGETLRLDNAGELHVDFRNLTVGFGYGVRWVG